MFNTKQGVFGPGGHGGGIFQTTVNGLGHFNTKQGVFGPGGHGGGICQTTVNGLGATSSARILAIQAEANAVLPQLGFPSIKEDGILGPETCGAIKAIIASNKYSGWILPSECDTTIPTAEIDLAYAYKPPMSTAAKVAIAGVTVLVVVGGYAAWKKFR